MNKTEAQSRIKINRLLEDANWRFFDNEGGSANIQLEQGTKITREVIDAFGENFEKTSDGRIDFLLLDENGFPQVVLEAKREDKSPLDGKEQAREYAQSLNVRYIILSNGNIHSHVDHTEAIIRHAFKSGIRRCYLHALLDGRDVGVQSALDFTEPFEKLFSELKELSLWIDYAFASGGGREAVTMDRDNNWEKVEINP